MGRVTPRKAYAFAFFAVLTFFALLTSSSLLAQSVTVGVQAGDYFKYQYLYSYQNGNPTPEVTEIDYFTETVTSIQGSVVNLQESTVWKNRSITYINGYVNVETGDGGFRYFVIPANLSAGDTCYYGRIDETITGYGRPTNHIYAEGYIPLLGGGGDNVWASVDYYWDKATGMIVEFGKNVHAAPVSGPTTDYTSRFVLIETNAWDVHVLPYIAEMFGTVEIQMPGENTWESAVVGSTLIDGDSVRTRTDSKAKIVFEDGSIIILGPDSVLKMKGNEESTWWDLLLMRGKFFIQEILHLRIRRVYTPTVVVAVRGTEFTVEVAEDNATTITVFEGAVEVQDIVSGSSVFLEANQTLTVPQVSGGLTQQDMSNRVTGVDLGSIDKWWTVIPEFSAITMVLTMAVFTACVAAIVYRKNRRRKNRTQKQRAEMSLEIR